MTNNIVDEVAQKLKATYDPDAFLGAIVWYGISETNVRPTIDDFNEVCATEGLRSRVSAPRTVDVFKRACKTAERLRYKPTPADLLALGYNPTVVHGGVDMSHINYMIRNAGTDSDTVWRVLVRETVDSSDHTIAHPQVATITYRRNGNSMFTNWETNDVTPFERELVQEITRYFAQETQTLTTNSVRNFITNTLERDQCAIRVRSTGGVFFVRNTFTDQTDALERVVQKVGGEFHSHPLIDDSKQRAMVRAAFEAEAKDGIDSVLAEMVEVSKAGKKISVDKWTAYNEQYEHYRTKIREFSDILDSSMTNCAAWLEVMKDQVDDLLYNHVQAKKA